MDFKDTIQVLKRAHRAGKTVLIRGNHGIGKSAVVAMYYQMLCAVHSEEATGYEDIRLSQMDVGDLRGIPFRVLGQTYFAPPNWFPVHPKDCARIDAWLQGADENFIPLQSKPWGILFMDEMNRATTEVKQASLEITNDRRMCGIHVPDGWLLVAAINSNRDLYDVGEFDPALLNRFVVIDFTPSPEDWYKYADARVAAGCMHPSVVSYLRAHGEKMDPADEDIAAATKRGEPLYTRRSWTNLGEYLWTPEGEKDITNFDNQREELHLLEVATGFLGADVARAFVNYIRSDYRTLSPKEVLDHWSSKADAYIKKLIDEHRVHELTGGIVSGVLAELKRRPGVLPKETTWNVIAFARALPGEVLSDFYNTWLKQDKAQSDAVYDTQAVGTDGLPLRDPKSGRVVCPFKSLVYAATARVSALGKADAGKA